MHKLRVYADTSVFGGTQDEEFDAPSKRFFADVHKGRYVVLVSPLTLAEVSRAPESVRQVLGGLPDRSVLEVAIELEAMELANAYIQAAVLGEAHRADATHVAAATVARADLILSWNFKHIVNYDRIRKFNGINALNGYASIDIRSPLELGYDDED